MKKVKPLSKNKRDVQAGLLALRKKMPALENIFDAFGPLVQAQEKAVISLEDWKFTLPAAYAPRFEQGVPFLSDMEFPELGEYYSEIFSLMASAIAEGMPALTDIVGKITKSIQNIDNINDLAKAIWDEDSNGLVQLVKDLDVDQDTLVFIGTMSLKPFMVRMEADAAKVIETMLWLKGYCPICGTFPDISLLRKSGDDNAYLKSHGGQRWMHCSCCGHEWRFKRNMCPWCESEDYKKLRYLQSEERQTERVDVCDTCKHYFVTIDTRELTEAPDPRIAPLGLVHLDIRAQEKKYKPMAETPWNIF
ncbi:formate dehydrogenase accessory protein FdhE [Maridesulfovibrio hydrothermalis]|uniref:Formate dehydrogenase accessory protein n=1 Tax=Maridesulfovibrio hydrothermalis AM13 = DSM 14728 TaxID=1121451 RepID=L0RBG5_9BACT|nr:formate dehydrogenase accessory protein FdhE [Maridesulfovibrio hydrothermalis]CCO24133.1 Formate dehydrogenase accessory protein [Maridesulfovibrio hydrothermalis AM13 = DSM 14728]